MVFFDYGLLLLKECIAFMGVLVIVFGAIRSAYQLLLCLIYKQFTTNTVRLQFGDSILLGLEFMVGADIVGSLVKPDYYNLGILALLVLIRTTLSYFLHRELESTTRVKPNAQMYQS